LNDFRPTIKFHAIMMEILTSSIGISNEFISLLEKFIALSFKHAIDI